MESTVICLTVTCATLDSVIPSCIQGVIQGKHSAARNVELPFWVLASAGMTIRCHLDCNMELEGTETAARLI